MKRKKVRLKKRKEKFQFDVIGAGLAVGTTWAIGMFFLGLTSIFEWGLLFVNVMSSVYIAYDSSFWGAIIGAIWGFVDGFLAGVLIAFFYNRFSRIHSAQR